MAEKRSNPGAPTSKHALPAQAQPMNAAPSKEATNRHTNPNKTKHLLSDGRSVHFAKEGYVAEVTKDLNILIESSRHNRARRSEPKTYHEIALEELGWLSLPGDVAASLEEVVRGFEGEVHLLRHEKDFRSHIPRLLVRAAAAAFHRASEASKKHPLQHEAQSDTALSPLGYFAVRDKAAFPTAKSYLLDAYKGRLGIDGDLDQATLRKLDSQLMDALNQEFRGGQRAELRALVPTKSDRLDQRLQKELGYVPQGAERKSAVTVLGRGHRPGLRKR